jgi:hypothetical protein
MFGAYASWIRECIFLGVSYVPMMFAAFYLSRGCWWWYRAGIGKGNRSPMEYGRDLFLGAVLMAPASYIGSMGGDAFSAQKGTGYAVMAMSTGDAATNAGINDTLAWCFALLAGLGWIGQIKAVMVLAEMGEGRNDGGFWRMTGLLFFGAVLSDLSNGVRAVDQLLGQGLFK